MKTTFVAAWLSLWAMSSPSLGDVVHPHAVGHQVGRRRIGGDKPHRRRSALKFVRVFARGGRAGLAASAIARPLLAAFADDAAFEDGH